MENVCTKLEILGGPSQQ